MTVLDSISGLPAHPLLVHVPVAMLPLAAVGVIVLLARRSWYDRYRWAVLLVAGVGTLGAILAASSGESLEGQVRAKDGAEAARALHDHVQAGETARNLAIAFFVLLAAYAIVPAILDRRRAAASPAAAPPSGMVWRRPVLMVAVAIGTVSATVSIIDAGHSGASKAWEEYRNSAAADDGE